MQALGVLLFLPAAMAIGWRVGLSSGKSGRIDAIWSFATGAAGAAAALMADGMLERRLLVAGMMALWGLRLGLYTWRRAEGQDDPRYADLKRQWGPEAPRKLFVFLQVQAVAAMPLALAAFVAAATPRAALGLQDALGLAIFIAALAGESLADRQMARFRSDPANRGRICDQGLWGWSRHPNYFFEWIGWFAYPAIAIAGAYWAGWLAFAAPALMYWLLVHVSGVPPLEQQLQKSRPEAFARYKRDVSVFVPLPPARAAEAR